MNNYVVKLTKQAKNDLKVINNYLVYNFQSKENALNIIKRLKLKIESLSDFPERFSLVNDYYLSKHKLRKCIMNHYIIFYLVRKNEKKVHIVRIVYDKSDWMKEI